MLVGSGQSIRFANGQDGVRLSADNEVSGLGLITEPNRCALFNDTSVERLGRLRLHDLHVIGAVRLLARDKVRGGHVEAYGIDIIAADARGHDVRPQGYGVEVIAGAFTLWNQQADPAVVVTADLTGLSAGRAGAAVRGSGIFVGGAGDTGGRLLVRRLETGAVFSDGGIAPGTPDRISGGVFVVHGAIVDRVVNHEPVTTYGANDMVLDNWGTVDTWVAKQKIASHGPSGIGFVNFGAINRLEVEAAVETFGQGARGFNVYAGTVRHAVFDRIITHGDGAVGIQINQPVGEIIVRRGIETYGGVGDSLVKGVVTRLAATAFSVKPGRRGAQGRDRRWIGDARRGRGAPRAARPDRDAGDHRWGRRERHRVWENLTHQGRSGYMTSDEQAVRTALQAYERALNESDTGAVMKLYSTDGVFMPQNGSSSVGSDAVRRAYDAVFAAIRLSVQFTIAEVRQLAPDWVMARTNSVGRVTVLATGESAPEANQELFLFQKIGGGWKIARYCFSTTNPPGSVA
jgi:uncharacterized protein (TIGR02246 family)